MRNNEECWSRFERLSRAGESEAVSAAAAKGKSVTVDTWGTTGGPEERSVID